MDTEIAATPKTETKKQHKLRGVYQRKPGAWWIRYVDAQGRLRREKAGTKSTAIELYRKRKTEALEGKKLPEKLRRRVSFAELCEEVAEYIEKRYAAPKHDLGRVDFLRRIFGARTADSITAPEIENALTRAKEENHWSASSVNHHRTLLSLAYRLAIRNGKADNNPVRAVRHEDEDNSRVRFLTLDEERRLRAVIHSNPAWSEHEPELDLALHTGLRRGNMYSLTWECVNLVSRIATIPRSKNGKPVHIPLNADAIKALMVFRSRGDGTGRVVRNEAGEPLNYPTHRFVPAVRAAGISDYRWHDNRHTYASRLRQTGTPLGNIAELLGHKGLAMTQRYAHLSISNLHEAVARIATPTDTTIAPEPVPEKARLDYIQ